ncbi:hypothetical protein A2U01_0113622, partial [Trifolium medium]|nr:hypothetical protein [Trifolium medium]
PTDGATDLTWGSDEESGQQTVVEQRSIRRRVGLYLQTLRCLCQKERRYSLSVKLRNEN